MTEIATERYRRPFSNVHWSLLVILVLLWEFSIFRWDCSEGPRYVGVILATSTVCISLWMNHCRVGLANTLRLKVKIMLGALYDLVAFFGLLIIAGLPIVIVMPTDQCYFTGRAKVVEMLLNNASLRDKINERILQSRTLISSGEGLQVSSNGRTKGGFVTKDGSIVAVSEDPIAVVMLSPSFANGSVTWKCTGFPTKHMPMSCREQ